MIKGEIISFKGFVLSSHKYKDKDSIVTLFTDGQFIKYKIYSGFQINSKNYGASIVGNFINVDLVKKGENYILQSYFTIEDNTYLYSDINKSLALQLLIESSVKCLNFNDELPFIYFKKCIDALKNNFDYLTVCYLYLCQVLKCCGLNPNVNHCVYCDKTSSLVSFSFYLGGFICQKHCISNHLQVYPNEYLNVIMYGNKINENQIERAILPNTTLKEVLFDLEVYLNDQLGVSLNSLKMLLDK